MQVSKIIREFSRSDEMKRPDGTVIWLKHGASVEAELESGDMECLGDLYKMLDEIVVAEVNVKMKVARQKFIEANKQQNQPSNDLINRIQNLPSRL